MFSIEITSEFLDKIFPFGFIMDENFKILMAGKSAIKLFPGCTGRSLQDQFQMVRPRHASFEIQSIKDFIDQIFILESKNYKVRLLLRGQFLYFQEKDIIAFVCSPWITDPGNLKNFKLKLRDFAIHDPITDLIQLLTVKEIASRDISKLNTQLKEKEKQYRDLVENSSDFVFKLNKDGFITYLNQVALEKMGYPKNEILGHPVSHFVKPEWQDPMIFHLKKILEKKQDESYLEVQILTKSSHPVWVGQHFKLSDSLGDPEIRVFAKDITEKKEVEENLKATELRLRNILSNMQSGILVETEDRRIALTNQLFCDLFGIPAPPEAIIGIDCTNAAEESRKLFMDPEIFVSRINVILRERKIVVGEELQMANGKYLERDYIPIFLGERYMGHLWVYHDTTEKKQAQQVLIEARKTAESAQKAEQQFLAHMSHEIRTPLNAIIGMSELLTQTETTQEQSHYLHALKGSADILLSLINDILDISKIESGNLEVNTGPFDLNQLLLNYQNTFQLQLLDKPVKFHVHSIPDIETFMISDQKLINQIFFNLLSNAVKFTRKGKIEIIPEVVRHQDNLYTIAFKVSDSGIGIPGDKLTKIFERFQQASAEVSTIYGGSGLGLAITKHIIYLLGGDITVKSEYGKGTEFIVTLHFEDSRVPITTNIDAAVKEHDPLLKDLRILVAEDNPMNILYVRKTLENVGARMDFAGTGIEALELAGKKLYDIILMDIQMPEMDGIEATREIRNSNNPNQNTVILALSASAFKEQISIAMQAGVQDYISKPFTPVQLILKISEFCKSERMHFEQILFDKDSLDELYSGDAEYASDMLNTFLEYTIPELDLMQEKLDLRDFIQAKALAHKLKPAFTMIGLPALHTRMNHIEELCKIGSEEAITELRALRHLLEIHLPNVKAWFYEM